jgi:hypothetical protein
MLIKFMTSIQVIVVRGHVQPLVCCHLNMKLSLPIEIVKQLIAKELKLNEDCITLWHRERPLKEDEYAPTLTLTVEHSFQQRTCPICLDQTYNLPNWGEPTKRDPVFFKCHHQLHLDCYVKLTQTSKKCPECSQPITFEEHAPPLQCWCL